MDKQIVFPNITRFALSIWFLVSTIATSAQSTKLANEYYQNNEVDKALSLYRSMAKEKANTPAVFPNYSEILLDRQEYSELEKYLHQISKWYPDNIQYELMAFRLEKSKNDEPKAQKTLQRLVSKYETNAYQLLQLSQGLSNLGMYLEAADCLVKARNLSGRKSQYALELANIYNAAGMKREMMDEYLLYAEENPYNLSYVKNILQGLLNDEADRENLETVLISKTQSYPDVILYSELLIWLEIQRKNFYAAFLQGRAIDKRFNTGGRECMNIAQIALENKAWDDAITIYDFVIKNFQEGSNYPLAKRLILKSKEERIKSAFPVTKTEIESLVNDYQLIVEEIGINNISLEALLSKARLQAFYLNQKDSAIQVLWFIINNKRSSPTLVASSKLELGDIFLLSGEPWESSLLYSQVEKANKDSPIAYEAKLRNARLSYFIGDFALAKSHLDILKLATTREIANDALFLSVQIQNNTAFDSTDYIMKQYAAIELLIFQNRYEEADLAFNQMLKDFPNHSLVDEIHWNLSKIELARGNHERALSHLDFIVKQYGYDILNDDAMFKTGEILANNMDQPDQALQIFIQFLKEHPGSSYASEARAYIRRLRGDLPN